MSGLSAVVEQPRAVIVALHGGASTAAYFDCPGHPELSLLRLGAELGYTVLALDRPGYGSSAPYADRTFDPVQRTALAYGAVDKMLGGRPRGAGLFLFAHSNGCELALRMATDDTAECRVVGLELAGTGMHYDPFAQEILDRATETHRPPGLRALLWEPAQFYPANVLTGITNSSTGAPYEATMVRDWPQTDFPALAARVRVPVHFSHAEHERVWRSDPDALAEIGDAFRAAPRFVTDSVADAGHNLSLGHSAETYHRTVLAFVDQCVAAGGPAAGLEAG
ncbi:alpha/beta fold hydrolase [Mycobacterium sp. WMMD1722]|uniref:alpha/beta fold hydrolase n=1 Tax=Mycobacterium sp. WMMD1722 TaxID=3404117 RepID=UPI003BF59A00